MRFNVGDQFVEFFDGDPEGYAYTVTHIAEGPVFYAQPSNRTHFQWNEAFNKHDHLVAPCAECEGVRLKFYANEKVYKCEECGNEWD